MLGKRILAALVFVPIFLPFVIYAGAFFNSLLFLVMTAIALIEYFGMAFPEDAAVRRILTVLGVSLYITWAVGIVFEGPNALFHFSFVLCFIAVFFYFLFNTGEIKTVADRTTRAVMGIVYVDCLLIFFPAIYVLPEGWRWVILLFGIVWLTDTGGFFFGKYLGSHKLYESVSPKKTWEGALGGTALGVGGSFAFVAVLGIDISYLQLIPLAVGASVIGQLGDLCESLLKRSFGIKDSGGLIPGHGGVLDRFDAMMFAAPFMYYYLTFVLAI